MRQTKVTERTQMTGQSIDYQSTDVWVIGGTCPFCGYTFLRLTTTKRPGPITIDENGIGQFTFNVTYEWSCSGCNSSGPASHIDNT